MDKNVTESLMNNGSFWLPESAATFTPYVDNVLSFVTIISIILFIIIMSAMTYFVIKYKRTKKRQHATAQITHNIPLEVAWTVIPLILTMIIFYWGFKGFVNLGTAPKNAQVIYVQGQKWFWTFKYPNGQNKLHELVVPVNHPIKLVMTSKDVIHSFFIPNFRMKRDVVPNKYTTIWFEANRIGTFQGFCTEYCGDQHSNMLATIRVLSQTDYDKWLASSNDAENDSLPLHKLGEKLYTDKGCNACHSLDGSKGIGPTWKNIYGTKRQLTDGTYVMADEPYLRESMMAPKKQVVMGFAPVMPSYDSLLSDKEINAIIEYIKVLK